MKPQKLLITLGTVTVLGFVKLPTPLQVLGATSTTLDQTTEVSKADFKIETTTAFDIKYQDESVPISYATTYEKDPNTPYGTETVITPGKDGQTTYTYKIIHWYDEIIDKQLVDTKTKNPTTEVISKGVKIVWNLYSTPDVGRVKYWRKLRVWATKYDANCIGCTGRTYSGTEVKKGVCATDPRVIPLGTNFYVDGYGLCRAEDIGGAIKGNDVDLGFVDASKGNWGAAYTDVYLLTNMPEDAVE
ncbi:MAG: 3D domain-containing protein [Patescibacteria group bacterium]